VSVSPSQTARMPTQNLCLFDRVKSFTGDIQDVDPNRGAGVYHHNDSETQLDAFQIRVSDGKGSVDLFFEVSILRINDNLPIAVV